MQLTNATKAQLAVFINSVVSAIVIFGLLTDIQAGALGLVANSALGVFIAMTYQNSPKRVPEGLEVDPGPPPTLEREDADSNE